MAKIKNTILSLRDGRGHMWDGRGHEGGGRGYMCGWWGNKDIWKHFHC